MGKKTIIRRLFKMLPMSSERFERTLELDNQILNNIDQRNEKLLIPDKDESSMDTNQLK